MSARAARRARRVRDFRIASARAPSNAKAIRTGAATVPGSLNPKRSYGRSQGKRRR